MGIDGAFRVIAYSEVFEKRSGLGGQDCGVSAGGGGRTSAFSSAAHADEISDSSLA